MKKVFSCRRVLVVASALVAALGARAADTPDITVTPIARDGQVLVSFELSDGFTLDVRDAIQSGLATTFSYEIELRRGTATWFDRTVAALTVSATVRFDNLTRRYQLSKAVDGRVEAAQRTENLDNVKEWMTKFEHVPLSRTSSLETNGEYYVRVRAHTQPRNAWFLWPWDRGSVLGRAKFTFIP
jgi:hypothetical protein